MRRGSLLGVLVSNSIGRQTVHLCLDYTVGPFVSQKRPTDYLETEEERCRFPCKIMCVKARTDGNGVRNSV